jgi:hypothetical protein
MRSYRSITIWALLFAVGASGFAAGQAASSPVLQAMQAELQRSMQKLKTQSRPTFSATRLSTRTQFQ